MSKKTKIRKAVREIAREVIGEDAQAGGSRPKKFRFGGDVYSATIEFDDRQQRLLLKVMLPERRPVSSGGGMREDVMEIQDYLESGIDIALTPIPGYYTDSMVVYRIDLDSLLRAII